MAVRDGRCVNVPEQMAVSTATTFTDVELSLPWPPSVNDYYGSRTHYNGAKCPACKKGAHAFVQRYIRPPGRIYGERVATVVEKTVTDWDLLPLTGDLFVSLTIHPPDRRKRDEDNLFKALWDSITTAKIWQDDSQVKMKLLQTGELDRQRGGRIELYVREIPPGVRAEIHIL